MVWLSVVVVVGDKFITGILLWDLSAAFDTLSADIFCNKLKVFIL